MEDKEYNRENSERAKYFNKMYSKYGFQIVPSPKVYKQFEESLELQKMGFTAIKPGFWGKSIDSNIIHLINLLALKGTAYALKWGVSLSYVPHKWEQKIKWHQTLKSSKFDLWCVSLDFFNCIGKDWLKGEQLLVHAGAGELFLRENIILTWSKFEKKVLDWYKTTSSITGIIQQAEEQIQDESKWIKHSPDPWLILGFSNGKLGQIERARQALNKYFNEGHETIESHKNLMDALGKITKQTP